MNIENCIYRKKLIYSISDNNIDSCHRQAKHNTKRNFALAITFAFAVIERIYNGYMMCLGMEPKWHIYVVHALGNSWDTLCCCRVTFDSFVVL